MPSITKTQPPPDQLHLPCPRCHSNHTKFCYYNNYNLAQPRYFCKSCRRYWTQGGALRNIPVGGGTRRNNSKRIPGPTSTTTSMPKAPTSAPVPVLGSFDLMQSSFTSLLNSQVEELDESFGGIWCANMWQLGNHGRNGVWPDATKFY